MRSNFPISGSNGFITRDVGDANSLAATRRQMLTTVAAGALGAAALSILGQPARAETPDPSSIKDEKEFRMVVLGLATLSLETSEIAVKKATQANAKEFAGFELTEAIAVTSVLKAMKTAPPPPDAKAQATLAKIQQEPAGPGFDQAYIKAQLENHQLLRDIAESYLKNSASKEGEMAEANTQKLATLALATFKEHVAITSRISKELQSA